MRTVIEVLLFSLLLLIGSRAIWKKGRKRDTVWYALLVVWCALIALTGTDERLPIGSLASLFEAVYAPIGKMMAKL